MKFDLGPIERAMEAHKKAEAISKAFTSDLTIRISQTSAGIILKNILTVQNIISAGAIWSVGTVVADLLAKALPRTPYDTGELRESGAARLFVGRSLGSGYAVDLAKGNADGSVSVDLSRLKIKNIQKSAKYISGIITFSRFGVFEGAYGDKENVDVALMTHEELLPFEKRPQKIPYTATKQGTGPKYLELPFLQMKNVYERYILDNLNETSISRIVKGISSKAKGSVAKTGKYTVDEVVLHNDLARIYGYFESASPRM